MKRIGICVTAVVFLLLNCGTLVLSEAHENWEVGTEISHITYKEPGIMEEKGMMHGIFGSYIYRSGFMLKAEGRFSAGQVDYDGELQDGTPYTIDNINNYGLEFRGLAGYDFPILKASILTPYIGIGYRNLYDAGSKDPAGYDRDSNYIYSPIGIEVVTDLDDKWSIGATAEYDIFWRGKQISYLSDANAGLSDPENTQRKGYGVRGSIKLMKRGEKFDFAIEPFIRYWKIEESDISAVTYYGNIVAYGYEPDNNSTEIGCKLAVMF